MLMKVGALFKHHGQDIQSIILYETYGVLIRGLPFGGALETRNLVSKFDRHHSARTGTKGLSIVLARHLKRSHLAQLYLGP